MTASGHYERPATVTRALAFLGGGQARLLAGGTDLYPATGDQSLSGDIVDLTGIEDLARITTVADGLRIGACIRVRIVGRFRVGFRVRTGVRIGVRIDVDVHIDVGVAAQDFRGLQKNTA